MKFFSTVSNICNEFSYSLEMGKSPKPANDILVDFNDCLGQNSWDKGTGN